MSDLFAQPDFQGDESTESVEDLDDEAGIEDEDAEEDEEENEETGAPEAVADSANAVAGGRAKAVLEHVSSSLVDEPEAVVVEVGPSRGGVKLSLHVAPGDMGRVIGRRGRTAQAIRTLVRAAAASEGTDAIVDIVD